MFSFMKRQEIHEWGWSNSETLLNEASRQKTGVFRREWLKEEVNGDIFRGVDFLEMAENTKNDTVSSLGKSSAGV